MRKALISSYRELPLDQIKEPWAQGVIKRGEKVEIDATLLINLGELTTR